MATFRLIDLSTGVVGVQLQFPFGGSFLDSPGRQALMAVNEQKFAGAVAFCWVDTICIDQQDDADMNQQIPLMGRTFSGAVAVAVILSCDLQTNQMEVDRLVEQLEPAARMQEEEAWAEEGDYWQNGPGRGLTVRGMRGLARLTTTAWATRVWTLQEYILASQVVWVGCDLVSLTIRDNFIGALPGICDTLNIEECLEDEFETCTGISAGCRTCVSSEATGRG